MKMEAIDMTTPLNLEMLKELRGTLAELTKQREMDEAMTGLELNEEQRKNIRVRDAATQAVMRGITMFCSPMVKIANAPSSATGGEK